MTPTNFIGLFLAFRHGVHAEEFKELSCNSRIERMHFVGECVLSLRQHIRVPTKPVDGTVVAEVKVKLLASSKRKLN